MKNGARYVVTTRWGTFSLDEGSYQDYLAGKLWICWTPGKPDQQQTPTDRIPINVTDRAIALREQADKGFDANGLPTLVDVSDPARIIHRTSPDIDMPDWAKGLA